MIDVKGLTNPTEEYLKKAKAYKALEEAGLAIPEELEEFFDWEEPSEEYMGINIKEAVSGDLLEEGKLTIELNKLPKGTTHIVVQSNW